MAKMKAPVPDEHLKAIGQITVNFAMLDGIIKFCIWSLIGQDQRLGQIITAELSFGSLLPLLNALCEHKGYLDSEARTELKALLKRAEEAQTKRDLITHSQWAAGKDLETITRTKTTARKFKEGIKFQFESMTVKDLEEIADFIAEVAYDVQTFNIRIFDPNFRKGV